MNNPATTARDNASHCEVKNIIVQCGEISKLYIGTAVALFDVDLIPLVARYKWCLSRKGRLLYVRTYAGGGRKNSKFIRLHRLIMAAEDGEIIDHINGDGLDNRRANLRRLSHSANIINAPAYRTSRSQVRGVCWYPRYGKWRAYIQVGGKMKTLGYFAEQATAVNARHAAEELYFPGANQRRTAS